MGWIITVFFLIFLLILPVRVVVKYSSFGKAIYTGISSFLFKVYPKEKKNQNKTEESGKERNREKIIRSKHKKSSENAVCSVSQTDEGGRIRDFFPLIETGLDFLNDLRKRIRLNNLECRIILAGEDPSSLALNYSRTWTAVGNLMPHLESLFRINKRNIEIECDFVSKETKIYFYLDARLSLGRCIWLIASYAFRALKQYSKLQNIKKGGASV